MAIVISAFLHSQTRDIALNSKKNTSITAMWNTFFLMFRSFPPTQLGDKPVLYRSVWKLSTQNFGERVMRHEHVFTCCWLLTWVQLSWAANALWTNRHCEYESSDLATGQENNLRIKDNQTYIIHASISFDVPRLILSTLHFKSPILLLKNNV